MSGGSIWDRFTVDPRHEANARLRASDRDRDVVNDLLGTAYSEGRLTPEELDERSDQVTRSKTLGELPAIIDDLVLRSDLVPTRARDYRAEAEHRYRQQLQSAFFGFLTPTLICWAIWFFTGADTFPWPIFVTIVSGGRLAPAADNAGGLHALDPARPGEEGAQTHRGEAQGARAGLPRRRGRPARGLSLSLVNQR